MSDFKNVYEEKQAIFDAMNRAQAIIEFDANGLVLNANAKFLNLFKYKLSEIKGKHHSIFVEDSFVNSDDYKFFWSELLQGKYQSGEFKRLTKYGKIVWIQAIYNPIYTVDGEVQKIIKFANDITREKELSLYYQAQIEAIKKSQAIAEFNSEGILLDANEIFLKSLGYSLDEVKGRPHSIFCEDNFVHSNEYKVFWEELKDGHYHSGQFKRITKAGLPIWIQASYNPIYGVDGKVVKIVKYSQNITAEKEKSLYNQGKLDAITKSQAVIEFNKNGVVLTANKNFLSIFNYSLEEIKGKHHSIFCEKQFVDSKEYSDFWEVLKSGQFKSGQFKRTNKNGKIIWLQAIYSPIYGIDGKIIKIIKFATDITKEKEESLYYKGQINAINRSEAVIEFDTNGVVISANNKFLNMMGYTEEDVKGCHHSIFCESIYANSDEYKTFWTDLNEGKYHSGVFKRKDKNGSIVFIRASYNPIYGVDGKVCKVIKYAHNISLEMNEDLFNRGKLEAISQTHAYLELDLKGNVITANNYFLKIFKYEDEGEIKGKNYDILFDSEILNSSSYKTWFRELLNGKHQTGQYKYFDKYGGIVWLQSSYSPIYGINGCILKIVQFATNITEQKEEELYNKGQIDAIGKSATMIEYDINGIVLNTNEMFSGITGYSLEEVRGKHHSIFCSNDFVNAKKYKKFWKDLKDGKFQSGEYKRFGKEKKVIWLQATYNPIYNVDGNIIKIVEYALDITKEKKESMYYQGQIEAISKSQAVIEFAVDGTILNANDNFLKLFNYHLDEIQGKHHSMLCDEALVNSPRYEKIWKSLASGKYHSGQYKRLDKDGQIVWIQASYNPIYDLEGNVSKIIKFAHNITKEKINSLYYQGQIEAINKSESVVEFDINGVILYANKKFLNTFHYTMEEIKNKHHSMFCDKDFVNSEEYKNFWSKLKLGKYQSGQFKRLNKEGGIVWIRASYNPIYGIDGSVIKIVKYAHDITAEQEIHIYTKAQVTAINKAQAVVEFDMNGTILSANNNFLNAMGYTLDEIKGKHHSMFCEENYIISTQYNEFWEKLQNGVHDSGKYLRIGKNGKRVWIRASYTPILNIENEPIRILKYAQDITELETIKLDKLTGLYNSGKLVADIEEGGVNNLAIINSNEYDVINDFYGILAGDTLIIQFSKILSHLINMNLLLYRLHNDRFAILNHTLSSEEFETEINNIIVKASSMTVDTRVNNLSLSLTCGIASGDKYEIINFAKIAHNHAKNTKQTIVSYSADLKIEEEFQNKIFWSKKIKTALKEDRFIVHYQPIFNNKTNKIEKYEVLVRMLERDRSLVYPNEFIDIAKTSKQYLEISRAVIKKAFTKFRDLPYEFSMNITLEDIKDVKLQEFLFSNIKKYGVGERLVIELVESERIEKYRPIASFVQKLKNLGVRLAIDDFGSGYSNFSHLLELEADFVKIDGSIVKCLYENTHSAEIIESITSFCKKMNIKVIAEFVSNEEIQKKITELGVDYSQGYYIGRPEEKLADQ